MPSSSSCYWGWSSPARGRSDWPWCRPPARPPAHSRCRSWRCRPDTTDPPAGRPGGLHRPHHRRPAPRPRHTQRRRAGCSRARTGPAGRSCRPPAPTAAPWSPSGPCCARYSQFSGPTRWRSSLKDETPRYPPCWPRRPRQCSAAAWPASPASAGRCHWPAWRCWSWDESWCLRCWIPVIWQYHKTSPDKERVAPGGEEVPRLLSHRTRLSALWECLQCLWRTEGWKYFDDIKDFSYIVFSGKIFLTNHPHNAPLWESKTHRSKLSHKRTGLEVFLGWRPVRKSDETQHTICASRPTCHGHSENSASPSLPESNPFRPHWTLLGVGRIPTGEALSGTKQHTSWSVRPQ